LQQNLVLPTASSMTASPTMNMLTLQTVRKYDFTV
jgi:hypothetical protein